MPFHVPAICRTCRHYDDGEYGDYGGGPLSGPFCARNVRFPTRTGFCWRHQPPHRRERRQHGQRERHAETPNLRFLDLWWLRLMETPDAPDHA